MRAFINKTIKVAKKHLLEGKDTREVDRYLRIRRVMFKKKFPREDARFVHIIQHVLCRQFNLRPNLP